MAISDYSSHDWRKNTDDAVVVDEHGTIIRPVNALKVKFTDPKDLKPYEVDISRLKKTSATLYDIADDISYKSRRNYTLNHLIERIKVYNEENFNYDIVNIPLKE